MFKNYLKITLAVMKRRKFFTFISLFGICMTLSILIVLTAFYEHVFSANYPEINRYRSLYGTLLELKDDEGNGQRGPMSFYFINTYIKTLKTPEKVGFSSTPSTINTYGNGKKLELFFKYTDPVFWEITQFEFLEGRPFTQQSIDNNEAIAIINDDTRDNYFGIGVPAVGKMIEMEDRSLRVVGVIRGCPITRFQVAADVYMPYNLQKYNGGQQLHGGYSVIVMAKTAADLPAVQAEFAGVVPRIPIPKTDDFKPTQLKSSLNGYFDSVVGELIDFSEGPIKTKFYLFAMLFAILFMSLPAINLVNINISRIMERSSEIGIRKAFGASSGKLVVQFVIENILLTLIGGILAIGISAVFLFWFNGSHLIDYADLSINWTVVSVTLGLSLVFGLMSGVYPAWRMSKLPVVEALKGA